ncbi:cap-specific mRNA (nucleoside-2'-O-)-methyltransferase 2 isoform X2 [Anguilla anguilla]|nr:cap-specific mRNA (nucleoside-2'-O-)-methyltransferase 2 isoform X2 [Anguilla anguilla]XP_035272373.1 cap-specific mRNA (nucleoside-2'-O-)-methyltransferase 2 isoform X2 [Anguilla anguilla]XP_035272374.1 cap-specific mRNA (nucleoside-2'-O-)-methyltransferase 2 isoform X2 [Anguilla anguilla]XP_035272375.1 cap-specific mRNA (nucleoside-2'-O-)-methyltransferase 2 isoform X2 [Anguilla anguilla]XP_035272376.1 cap-specific mRNA (nucleoside-2'-O-)-methyltransferase 2 isoform X2 [Anguilla anguilla]
MSRRRGVRKKIFTENRADPIFFSTDIESEIQELFNKTTTYSKPASGEWVIPDPNQALRYDPQQHPRLQALKESLNAVKDQLSDKNLEVWHQHTSFTNRAGKIIAHVRAAANAEICTQAWCKFYEILGTFGLVPYGALQSGELNSVHLCEAPGAFIASLNHYLRSNSVHCDWTWAANTLNPYHEANDNGAMIADDRLIANTLPWWFFGSDDTGDLMTQEYLLELQGFTRNMRTVDLVTADGSFDCQANPDEQESLVAPLHYCEAVAALLLLSPGGSFVLKAFTLYEHSSVCLLYLLNCCFRAVHVFKPATSKAGNSEVYVVCLDYCGKDDVKPLLSKMIRNFGPDIAGRGALFPNSLIPESFLRQHEQICTYFHTHQVQTITENLRLFEAMGALKRGRLNLLRDHAVQVYMERFRVQHVSRSEWLSKNLVPACSANGKLFNSRKQAGTFNERKKLQTLDWMEKVGRGSCRASVEEHVAEAVGKDCLLAGPTDDCSMDAWHVLVGTAIPKVRSSPFCDLDLLNHLNEALEQSGVTKDDGPRVPSCGSCRVLTPESILSEAVGLHRGRLLHGAGGQKLHCLVVGSPRLAGCLPQTDELHLECSEGPAPPDAGRGTLHDGEPQYQRELLACVLRALRRLRTGGTLVLPLVSAFTRFTAGLVFALHQCFRSVTFRCPAPADALGAVAVLLCADYCCVPDDWVLRFLGEMHSKMPDSPQPASPRQVLQFVPMDVLLKGPLPEFLWTMNTTIARYRLHLLVQAKQHSIKATA